MLHERGLQRVGIALDYAEQCQRTVWALVMCQTWPRELAEPQCCQNPKFSLVINMAVQLRSLKAAYKTP